MKNLELVEFDFQDEDPVVKCFICHRVITRVINMTLHQVNELAKVHSCGDIK